MEKLITRKEAAKILGISLTTLDEARNSGLISYIQYVPIILYLFCLLGKNTSFVKGQCAPKA